ncbi:MAG: hypothetical protein ROO76_23770 [Terriglobia bacterium]|nr:hypothetical protein [Terriglobia bacterium]
MDERLDSFRRFPNDETVELIAADLWGCYDDLKDHKVVATKETWNYFNRVLVLLSSDAELERGGRNEFRWHTGQFLPGICLLLVLGLSVRVGLNLELLEVFIPFGLVSMAISWMNRRRNICNPAPETYPFPSFTSLSAVRRRAGFSSKMPWHKPLGSRTIRHPLIAAMMWAPSIAAWLVLSPIILLFQSLPERMRNARLKYN